MGEFFYPNSEKLVLREAGAESAPKLVVAEEGQSCASYVVALGQQCWAVLGQC